MISLKSVTPDDDTNARRGRQNGPVRRKTERVETERVETEGVETEGVETERVETEGVETERVETAAHRRKVTVKNSEKNFIS
jgi:hypothetical protein